MKILCKNKNWKLNEEYNIDKILYLLVDRPSENIDHDEFFWKNIYLEDHRDYNLPSYYNNWGYVEWCKNHDFYREDDKASVIWIDGSREYWSNGNFIKEEK